MALIYRCTSCRIHHDTQQVYALGETFVCGPYFFAHDPLGYRKIAKAVTKLEQYNARMARQRKKEAEAPLFSIQKHKSKKLDPDA